MKSLKNTIVIFLLLFTANAAFAQKMKEPVRYKLKNGATLIVAQNEGFNKVYARLTVEGQNAMPAQEAQLFRSYLGKKTEEFNKNAAVDKEVVPQVDLTACEANTASSVADFEQTLHYVADHFFAPQANHITNSDLVITIAGDISPAAAKSMVNKMFSARTLAAL